MKVLNVRWVGIRTDNYREMVGFLRDVLGLTTNFEEPTTVELATTEGDQIQVMAPGDPYYEFFGGARDGACPAVRGRRRPRRAPRARGRRSRDRR